MNPKPGDNERFDDLTRLLATPASRRVVLKGLAGTMTAGLFALFGTTGAHAAEPAADDPNRRRCRPILAHCRNFRQCCSGICLSVLKICL